MIKIHWGQYNNYFPSFLRTYQRHVLSSYLFLTTYLHNSSSLSFLKFRLLPPALASLFNSTFTLWFSQTSHSHRKPNLRVTTHCCVVLQRYFIFIYCHHITLNFSCFMISTQASNCHEDFSTAKILLFIGNGAYLIPFHKYFSIFCLNNDRYYKKKRFMVIIVAPILHPFPNVLSPPAPTSQQNFTQRILQEIIISAVVKF